MRIFRNIVFLILVFLCVAFFSINSHFINIRFLPSDFTTLQIDVRIPLYLVMLICLAIGLFLGTLFEYFRTWSDRIVSRKRLREVEKLNSKIKYLTSEKTSETDEILGLLK